jgi:NADH-quinone oxidoreductase subunit F
MAQPTSPDLDKRLEEILSRRRGGGRADLLPTLLETQQVLGSIPDAAAEAIGRALRVPLSEVDGVIEFYSMLYKQPTARTVVRVCTSPICSQKGGEGVLHAARRIHGNGDYRVEEAPCLGLCDHAPAALVAETPVGDLDGNDPRQWIENSAALPLGVIGGSPRWLSGRCGQVDPIRPGDYEAKGGLAGLRRALSMSPEQIVEEIKASGLVGRGGAAFPAGMKWEMVARATDPEHIVVCNADESEPGTFKDRVIMEGDPFFIVEGMAICGYAVGARRGYLYVRGEYPRAQAILSRAIAEARSRGWLGESVLGTPFSFDIELRSGAGAYICGEETALFESIEGKRGYPRLKPPYPTTHGLFGKPTVINNVETLCTAAWILANGWEAYRSIGTKESPGSKLFCLSGDVARPGVYEAPFGTKLRDLLEMAGGVQGELAAVLLGGAAGAFAGPEALEVPMSFEGLKSAGLALGSGVVVAINRTRDMRAILLSLGRFFAHESCGKCFPCQLGTQRQMEILERVAQGQGTDRDAAALHDIGFTMTAASLCGLGMTAGTAVLSALKRWPELFGVHAGG